MRVYAHVDTNVCWYAYTDLYAIDQIQALAPSPWTFEGTFDGTYDGTFDGIFDGIFDGTFNRHTPGCDGRNTGSGRATSGCTRLFYISGPRPA